MIPPRPVHTPECNRKIPHHGCDCMPARVLHARGYWWRARIQTAVCLVGGCSLGAFVGHFLARISA